MNARPPVGRELAWAWLHLAVLWSLALAQPLLDLLADNPEFFVARGNTRGDILLLAFGLVLVPPTILLAVEAVFLAAGRAARRAAHAVLMGVLAGAFVLNLLNELIPSVVLIPMAIALGCAFALAYQRTRFAPAVLTALSPAPVLFLVLFLVASPVSKLVFPSDATGQGSVEVDGDTPVVVLVFDELSVTSLMDARHRIDGRRYPNFARLARDGTWYRNATTVADVTPQAVPALLSGRRPDRDALPIAADHPGNLFTLLAGSYSFEVIEPVTDVCPAHLCGESTREPKSDRLSGLISDLSIVSLHLGLPDDLRDDLPAVDRTFGDFDDDGPPVGTGGQARNAARFRLTHRRALEDRVGQLNAFERGLGRRSSRPTLHYLHVQLPHLAYRYLPSGQQYPVRVADPPGLRPAGWGGDTWAAEQAFQRYSLQVGYVDRFLGRVFDRLRATGAYDRALIAVTSDHGVSFRPGAPRREVTQETLAQIAGVPLIVKGPGQRRGRVDDAQVSTLDLLPTLADHLDVALPWDADGRSALERGGRQAGPVRVQSQAGGDVDVSFEDYRRQRDAEVDRTAALFGAGGMFRFGPDADLIGASVQSLQPAASSGRRVVLDSPQLYSSVDPRDAVVPAFVTGRVEGSATAGLRLIVAVNGRIEATTRPYESVAGRFGAMIAPTSFRPGGNTVEVFAVDGAGAARRLARLSRPVAGGAGEAFALKRRGGREVLAAASGREITVRPGAVQGAYEAVRLDFSARRFSVAGWAASARQGAADRVVAFVDGRFIVAGRPSRPRPDVAKRLGPDARDSGFALTAGIDTDSEINRKSGARVFAISGNRASELRRAPR